MVDARASGGCRAWCIAGASLCGEGCDAGGGVSRGEGWVPDVDRSRRQDGSGERTCEELHRDRESTSCGLIPMRRSRTLRLWLLEKKRDLADGHEAARIEGQADVAQLVEQLIRNQ
jgi:hypothetical protein